MFCERCGNKLLDEAEFCTNCGTRIVGETKKTAERILDTEIQLRVKPSFKFGYMVIPSLIIYGSLILMFSWWTGTLIEGASLGVFLVGILIMLITLGIKTPINKKQYENIFYDFYKTKVVYRDSFFKISEKEVKYKNIKVVKMSQGFLQRYFNIGNIMIFTNAELGLDNGIYIKNVENVKDIYRDIKTFIDL